MGRQERRVRDWTCQSTKHPAGTFPSSLIFSPRRQHKVQYAVLRICQSWSRKQFFTEAKWGETLNNYYTIELKLNLFSRSLYSRNKLYFMPWRNSVWKMKVAEESVPMLFGAKIWSDICPRTLSVPWRKLFASRNRLCPRKISERIFTPIGGYCVYYPSNLFWNTCSLLLLLLLLLLLFVFYFYFVYFFNIFIG